MKIAVIGAGVSGLTAAWVLQREHQVSVFEKADRAGGHASTLDVDQNGRSHRVDIGFGVYNTVTYPGSGHHAHYATTLRRWRSNFLARRADVEALGFSASFQRMWEFYFCYCEAVFRERTVGNVQLLLALPRATVAGVVPQV